jgi:hypothetical protein
MPTFRQLVIKVRDTLSIVGGKCNATLGLGAQFTSTLEFGGRGRFAWPAARPGSSRAWPAGQAAPM